jgi:hypothetical protein
MIASEILVATLIVTYEFAAFGIPVNLDLALVPRRHIIV